MNDIVPHQGRQAIAAVLGRALYRYARRIGQDALDQLTDQLTNDIVSGGRDALQSLRSTVQQFGQQHAAQLGNSAFHIVEGMRNAVSNA